MADVNGIVGVTSPGQIIMCLPAFENHAAGTMYSSSAAANRTAPAGLQ